MQSTAAARAALLKTRREPFLRRARKCAALTIPSLLPPEGHSGTSDLPEPYSGHTARCVVHLGSRLLIAFLPPGQSAFRFSVSARALMQSGAEATPPDIERKLALVERIAHNEIERKSWRAPTGQTLLQLIVAGNALEQMLPDNTIRTFKLDQFMVVRNPTGKVVEILLEEMVLPIALSPELQALVPARQDDSTTPIPLYTCMKLDGKVWTVKQEINDVPVPGSEGTYEEDVFPFFVLTWDRVAGEDYGRSKVEYHLPDIIAIEGLQKSIIEGAALASRHVQMIRPNAAGGLNLRRRLAAAKNGDWVVGNPDDVGMLKYENFAQMQFVQSELQALKQDISAAFLLNSGLRRDAERVTAYELRQIAEELEGVLGGVYSTLSQDMSLKRVRRLVFQMQREKALPEWKRDEVDPTILTGLEALGREQDVQRAATAMQFAQNLPDEAQLYVKWPVILNKGFTGMGFADAVNDEATVNQKRQQQAAMQAMTAAAPQVARAVTEQGAVE